MQQEHKPLPSQYPLEVSVSSLLELCVPIPSYYPWGVRDGTSQSISSSAASLDARQVLSKTAAQGAAQCAFPLQNKPAVPCKETHCPQCGVATEPGTLHPIGTDTARQAADRLCRQPRWDPCPERLLPGAGYRASDCSQLSQTFTALARLLKAEEQSLMPSPGSNPLLGHLLAVAWLDTTMGTIHGQEPPWPRLTPCLSGSNPTAQGCSPTIAPHSCEPSPPAPTAHDTSPPLTATHLDRTTFPKCLRTSF